MAGTPEPPEPLDKELLAREASSAPKGTRILASGASAQAGLPSFADIHASVLRSVTPDFQRGRALRDAVRCSRPYRLTDVPPQRFAAAMGVTEKRKAIMFEDVNYLGVANMQIYAFFGLTAAAGLGSVVILAWMPTFPHVSFALPFALASGWQTYTYYLSTWAACRQATKTQYLRMIQGGVDDPRTRGSQWFDFYHGNSAARESEAASAAATAAAAAAAAVAVSDGALSPSETATASGNDEESRAATNQQQWADTTAPAVAVSPAMQPSASSAKKAAEEAKFALLRDAAAARA